MEALRSAFAELVPASLLKDFSVADLYADLPCALSYIAGTCSVARVFSGPRALGRSFCVPGPLVLRARRRGNALALTAVCPLGSGPS